MIRQKTPNLSVSRDLGQLLADACAINESVQRRSRYPEKIDQLRRFDDIDAATLVNWGICYQTPELLAYDAKRSYNLFRAASFHFSWVD
ncbi:MAG: hypothetical protein MK165_14295 [Pirellulaceae bacterium]|nr:hypothetical protein [Pirellulaceae bacterium]